MEGWGDEGGEELGWKWPVCGRNGGVAGFVDCSRVCLFFLSFFLFFGGGEMFFFGVCVCEGEGWLVLFLGFVRKLCQGALGADASEDSVALLSHPRRLVLRHTKNIIHTHI